MEPTAQSTGDGEPSFFAQVRDEILFAGPVEFSGIVIFLAALCLLVGTPYLAKRRRHVLLLLVAVLLLGTTGYALYDHRYVQLNVRLRDVEQVRADCEKLLQASRAANGQERFLSAAGDADFPASFQRIGAVGAFATGDCVSIDLGIDECLYCPQISTLVGEDGTLRTTGATWKARRTLYRGFYHYWHTME